MTSLVFDDAHFLRESVVDINAAVVGISKARWVAVKSDEATVAQAKAKMEKYRFDILPVADGPELEVKGYFCTDKWNDFSSISQKNVTHRDVIPFHTHLRDVIKGFASERRQFYFLGNERRIVGLISIVNLNCRQVKVYLFSLLSELEVSLADFIDQYSKEQAISEDKLVAFTFGKETKVKYVEVKKRYEDDKASGLDVPFVQYLYLPDLINIMTSTKFKLYERLGYSSGKNFKKNLPLGSLVNLRNKVTHPARSIVTDESSVQDLWEKIDLIDEALFKLSSR